MTFIKGDNRINRKGREKGSINHLNAVKKQLQQLLGDVLLEELQKDNISLVLGKSTPAARLKFITETLKFIVPTATVDIELDDIILQLELIEDAKAKKDK